MSTDDRQLLLRKRFDIGRAESPGEFIKYRANWIAEIGSVRVQPAPGGHGWDVVLRIDGTYSDRTVAEYQAAAFQAEVHGIAAKLTHNSQKLHDLYYGTANTAVAR